MRVLASLGSDGIRLSEFSPFCCDREQFFIFAKALV